MLKSYAPTKSKSCSFCLNQISKIEDSLVCSECGKYHHKNCWQYNLNRCASFGCKGTKAFTPTPVKEEESKPKIVVQEKIIIGEAETVAPKLLNIKPIKKVPKTLKKKDVKEEKVTKNVPLVTSGNIPKPEAYIPEYVFEDLKKPEEKVIKKYQKIPGADKFNKKDTPDISSIPKPDEFIPDYVNEPFKQQEQQVVIRRYTKPPIFKSLQGMRDLKKYLQENPIPIPDPYIPDYVYAKLSDTPKRKKLLKAFKPIRTPKIFYQPEDDDFDIIPEADAYIPDYVNEELKNTPKIFLLPEQLIKTKECINCGYKISIKLYKCTNCKKNPDIKEEQYYIKPKSSEHEDNIIEESEHESIFINSQDIKSVVVSIDNKYICFGAKDKKIKLYDFETKNLVRTFEGHTNHVNTVDFSPDGKYLISGSVDTTIKIWNIESGECIKTITGNTMGFNSVKYSPDGYYLLSTSGEGMIKVWGVESGMCLRFMKADMSWVTSASFSPDLQFIVSADSDMTVRVWDTLNGTHLKSFSGHLDSVNDVCYSPSGRYIVSGGKDNLVKIWDTLDTDPVKNFYGHFESVNSVRFSPDGRYIATGSSDKTIKIWDVVKSSQVRNLIGHKSSVNSIAYDKTGRYIISGSDDKTIKIWKLV